MFILKIRCKALALCIVIPLLTGVVSGLLSRGGMEDFGNVIKPPLSPPGWLFPVVWTILYTMMGIASYLVLVGNGSGADTEKALLTYSVQLFFNFLWSIIFFNFELYTFAFLWLVALLVLIIITAVRFAKISRPAAYLMIPYILWVTFAGYLNFGIAVMN